MQGSRLKWGAGGERKGRRWTKEDQVEREGFAGDVSSIQDYVGLTNHLLLPKQIRRNNSSSSAASSSLLLIRGRPPTGDLSNADRPHKRWAHLRATSLQCKCGNNVRNEVLDL
ncbi:hypothetical protein B296_00009752 [Ensete ventricosum]|uniref:Uncharacterized protein n=1 Tax=Ensete ventricosum TaxID=4639 RepID=A0A426ZZ79_ENSVE|nr:hypothetical protein B296_00009752 [Ensete ventricosum]